MVLDTARKLALELRNSPEYLSYEKAREEVYAQEDLRALLEKYHKLTYRVQGDKLSGVRNEKNFEELKKLGELLQFSPEAASYLMAEYKLNGLVSEIYRIVGEAAGMDFSVLENGS